VPEILVTEDIQGAALTELASVYSVAVEPDIWQDSGRLIEVLQTARAVIVRNQTQITDEIISACPNLEVIGRAGAGLDNIDTASAEKHGVPVVYTPNENSISVAELVMTLMLSLVRRIPQAWQDTRTGGWKRKEFTGGELFGKTLGIVGFGRIGRLVAQRARAFGMTLIAHDDFVSADSPEAAELDTALVSLDELLSRSDFVTLHVPLTESTNGFFGADQFRQMKPTACFINSSRGEVVNENDLVAALDTAEIAAVALDVRLLEPPELGRLESMDNVILTPHIGAFSREAQDRVVTKVCRDVANVLAANG
jgi:D-3-phosphoglycerate dehydrogenase / 2-oxoglutarate reductase